MGFNGYWFNNYKQKYLTYKYPHCYIGVKRESDLGVFYGNFNKEGISANLGSFNKEGISANLGSFNKSGISVMPGIFEGGDNMLKTHVLPLNSAYFQFDQTPGFQMAVEKEWHKCDPVSLDNPPSNTKFYDIEGNELPKTNYALTIYYKLVVPLCYIDGFDSLDNDLIKYRISSGGYLYRCTCMDKGIVIGTPVLRCAGEPQATRALVLNPEIYKGDPTNTAYFLPFEPLYKLNETNLPDTDFATGADIAAGWGSDIGNKYVTLRAYTTSSGVREPISNNDNSQRYLFMNFNGANRAPGGTGALNGFELNTSNKTVSYSVNVSAALMNLPVTGAISGKFNFFMPEVFTPFGLSLISYNEYGNYVQTGQMDEATAQAYCKKDDLMKKTSGWIYYVFGVKELS